MKFGAKVGQRAALAASLFLVVLSSGLIIAHQCHAAPDTSQTIVADHHVHTHAVAVATKAVTEVSTILQKVTPGALLDSGCAALVVIVLFAIKKFLLPRIRRHLYSHLGSLRAIFTHRALPSSRRLALSLPQLGVIRI
jgi:hypothetical protein